MSNKNSKESKTDKVLPEGFFKNFKSPEDLKSFFKDVLKQGFEEMLQGELDDHLGYSKHAKKGYNSGNSRNGSYSKTFSTESVGDMVLNIPRDRNSEFEPKLIPKGKSISEEIENAVIGMYGRGMTVSDISFQLEQIYGLEISTTTISNITERIIHLAKEWQNRPLEEQYFIVWLDGLRIKIRQDGKIISKCIYIVLGLNKDGCKDVLGIWINETESASFWLSVLNDLKARGVNDIFIACTDNLSGFEQAIAAVYPDTINQLCVVHQIKNSCKFVVWKDLKAFCADMKAIYTAVNLQQAQENFETFKANWFAKYKYAIESWERNWERLTQFFNFPVEIRKIMYTTNTIENLNRNIRKYTKTKTQFPNDDAAFKAVFMAIENIQKKNQRGVQNWGVIFNQFNIIFANRIKD